MPYGRAIDAARRAGASEELARLGEAGGSAWLARVVRAFGDPASAGVDGVLLELRIEATAGLDQLRVLGRLSTTVGVLGALGALGWLRFADHGLAGLEAGLPEAMAMGWAVDAIGRGFTAGLFASGAATLLARRARSLLLEARELAEALDPA